MPVETLHPKTGESEPGSQPVDPRVGGDTEAPACQDGIRPLETISALPASGSTIPLGIACGGYVAAVWANADAVAAALFGEGIPWVFAPMLMGSFLLVGWLVGGLVGGGLALGFRARGNADAPGSRTAQVRSAVLNISLVVVGVMFLERLFYGHDAQFGLRLAPISIAAGLIGILVALVLAKRRPFASASVHRYTWQVLFIALCAILWSPFNDLHHGPMFGMGSLIMNLGYLVVAIIVYLSVWAVIARIPERIGANETLRYFRWTLFACSLGLVFSSAALTSVTPRPIDEPYPARGAGIVPHPADRPNVVIIVVDTTRADHLSPYGYRLDTTPALSAFAREGVLYTNAISPSSWTYPSHVSIFTGLMPTEHGAHYRAKSEDDRSLIRPLGDGYTTLAEVLQARGYYTGAIISNTVPLKHELGVSQGFHYYDDRARPGLDTARLRTVSPGLWLSRFFQRFTGRTRLGYRLRDAAEINADVFEWLEEAGASPFFLFINYADPHRPYRPHPEFDTQLALERTEAGRASETSQQDSPHPNIPSELWGDVALYDGELAHVDSYLGKLFSGLRERGLYDTSLIMVTSDHGEAFGEHGYTDHVNSVYQEEVWVPLMIRYPGGGTRGLEQAYTSLTSLFHLVLDHLDISIEIPELAPQREDRRPGVMAELYRRERLEDDKTQWITRALYGQDGVKTITVPTEPGEVEIYNLEKDPFELVDLSPQYVTSGKEANTRLREWAMAAESGRRSSDEEVISRQLVEQLRSLGYVD